MEAEVQHGITAHRQSHHVSMGQLQMLHEAHDVFHGSHLRVSTDIVWHIRRGVAAGIVGDDSVAP